jgi:hypothetical protein
MDCGVVVSETLFRRRIDNQAWLPLARSAVKKPLGKDGSKPERMRHEPSHGWYGLRGGR